MLAPSDAIDPPIGDPSAQPSRSAGNQSGAIPKYAYYALIILMMTSVLNYLDRLILSILAQSIKTDLKLTDAELGFLLGTGLAVFYSIVGIAMGRIADAVSRTRLMAIGLTTWSLMTALGAGATSFAGLALARIGVGIGEATGNPTAHSLITEYFPRRRRSLALAVYVCGTFIGGASALIIGGYLLQHWPTMCSSVPLSLACDLKGWQATLILVGLPGFPLAALVATLREPPVEGQEKVPLGKLLVREFGAAVPPITLYVIFRSGDRAALRANLLLIAVIIAIAAALVALTGDRAQWWAIALGAYAVVTWGQVLKRRDPAFYRLTFGCPTFVIAMLSGAFVATTTGAVSAWAAPYAIRQMGMTPAQVGGALGIILIVASATGVVSGGWLADKWKQSNPAAPIWVAALSPGGGLPALAFMLMAETPTAYLMSYGVFALFSAGWGGAYAAMIQDLVLPRMRGGASSAFALVNIMISAGAGPYWVGKVSTITGSLAEGLISVQLLVPVAFLFLVLAARRLRHETPEGRRMRAQAAGEPIMSGDD